MLNVPKSCFTRAHKSDIDLAKMMSDPKSAMRNRASRSFLNMFLRQEQEVQEQTAISDDALRPDDEGPSSIPKHGTSPASEFHSYFLKNPQLQAQIEKIAQEKARHIYALKMDSSLLRAAKYALLDALPICLSLRTTN